MWHDCKETALRGLTPDLLIATLDFLGVSITPLEIGGGTLYEVAADGKTNIISETALREMTVARFRRKSMEMMKVKRKRR